MATSFDPTAVLGQLIASYARLPLSQKVAFPVLIMASVAGIVFVSNWATAPDYTVLYSDLEPGDSAAVVERLKTQKVKYQVRADGGTIAISPPELVHELRISLAAEGIPKGGVVGFEIFDTTNLGTTSFVEKLKFVRALQGELERTITSLESISSARVHITKPEKTVFATKGAVPTASVMLRLRSMDDMDPGQVKGIANLVAASVEGLTPENVTIIDVHGNLLTDHDQNEDGLGIETTRLQYQRELERGFVREIEEMLRKVVGPGKSLHA